MSRYTVGLCAQLEDFSETHFRFSRKANVLDRGVAIFTELDAEVASVMADALNIHEATGLTPSQLQARVAELEATGLTPSQLQARVAELEAALRELLSSTSLKEIGKSTGFRDLLVTGDDVRAGFKALEKA